MTALLDVMAVPATGDAAAAVVECGEPSANIEEKACDVLVVGGGTGGIAAALAAARAGRRVCLLEETDWIGGQLTAQGVSARATLVRVRMARRPDSTKDRAMA